MIAKKVSSSFDMEHQDLLHTFMSPNPVSSCIALPHDVSKAISSMLK